MVIYRLKKSNPYFGKDLKEIREIGHRSQKEICPVLKTKIPIEDMVVDHAHKDNSFNLKNNKEAGLIRGIIQRQVNVIEGKITNSFIRCGLHKVDITLPELLRNLADYLERPPLVQYGILHPSEKKKPLKLSKNSVKQLHKEFKKKYTKKKFPGYPKSGKLTATLMFLFEEFKIKPLFLKGK